MLSKGFIGALAAIVLFLSTGQPAFAGAWTMGKGKLYNRLALNCYFADEEFDRDGDRTDFADNGEFRDLNLNNYLEYGITDRLTGIASVYYKKIEKEDDLREVDTWGLGDVDLALKYKLFERPWGILSVQGLVKIPGLYDEDDELSLGNGQYDVEVRVLYGKSLWPKIPGYLNLEAGYRKRFEAPSDEIRYLLEFGLDFSKQLYGRIKLDGLYSLDNGEHLDPSGNPTITNNFDLGKLDAAIGYKVSERFGFEAGYTPSIYGQNTAAGATYTFAFIYHIK